jgi:phage tail-like protein
MTHPSDLVYRFSTLAHWARGASDGLVFGGDGGGGVLQTPAQLVACPLAQLAVGETITAMARDAMGRPMWLTGRGILWALAEPGPVQIADLPDAVARLARRLIWGQDIGWVVAGDDIVRLDARTGNRLGSFAETGWRVVDAVAERCDGVIVLEVQQRKGREVSRLREIRPEGTARLHLTLGEIGTPLGATRFDTQSPVHVFATNDGGWKSFEVEGTEVTATHDYPGDANTAPTPVATMTAAWRVVMGAPAEASIFSAAFGLLEPVQQVDGLPAGHVTALLWAGGTLYAVAGRKVFALRPDDADGPARKAIYLGPVLRSPPGDRSGWLRADVQAELPPGARVILRHRGFATAAEAAAYSAALRAAPASSIVRDGWEDAEASTHFGGGEDGALRHYLGDVTQEYLALRVDISLPACAPAVHLRSMSVTYPNRSLIEELPAIYRTGGPSERHTRRMLAPFQALIDEIDDLIGDSVRRVDPATADDLWTGFLLQWLGHEGFVRLDPARRRGLLRALPEVLGLRGTLAGLARVLDELVPGGYAIEDSGLTPDVWVLPEARDPAGARLGRETRTARHAPQPLTLGGCLPLGEAVLKHTCFDPTSVAGRCHGEVTVHVFGGAAAEEALAPFADRILRVFVPAHTRVRFSYSAHLPPEALERGRSRGPDADPASLITLDTGASRNLGAWRLPGAGRVVRDDPATLNSAVLDGTLILH